jgi:hypothetical protein
MRIDLNFYWLLLIFCQSATVGASPSSSGNAQFKNRKLAKIKKMDQVVSLKIKHSIKLTDGLEIRFDYISIEESVPPPGSKEPRRAGVNVTLSLKNSAAKKGEVHLSQLVSEANLPSLPVKWEGYEIVLLGSQDEYREAMVKLNIKKML